MIKTHHLCITLLLICCYGCASTLYDEGQYWLEKENYDAAIQSFRDALKENPDFQVKRELGIAYYRTGALAQAQDWLQQAQATAPEDGRTLLYLGRVYEKRGMYRAAMKVYKNFPLVGGFRKYRGQIRARFEVMKKEIRAQIQTNLEKERNNQPIPLDEIPIHTVAVMYFDNSDVEDARLRVLQKGIAELLIADLSKVAFITVVEREQLHYLWDELKLGESGVIDPETAQRYGKLLGANWVIAGAYFDLAAERLQIEAYPEQTKTSQHFPPVEETNALDHFWVMQKNLVFELIQERMNIELTEYERNAIQRVPTQSLEAFLAFSEGLALLDRGERVAARGKFQQAVQADPNFTEASDMLKPPTEPTTLPAPLEPFESELQQEEFQTILRQDILERTSGDRGAGVVTAEQLQPPPPPLPERVRTQIRVNF